MEFGNAKHFVITFGKYKHRPKTERTLDAIAATDEGLLYLDWLRGSLHERCEDWQEELRGALDVYLADAAIAAELRSLLQARKTMTRGPYASFAQAGRAADCGYAK